MSDRCPECGYDPTEKLPRRSPLDWRSMWPAGIVFVALLAFAVWLVRDFESSRGVQSFGSASLITPHIGETELEDAAASRATAPVFDLVDQWVTKHQSELLRFADARIEFSYVPLSHERRSYVAIGWPFTLWSRVITESFDDPVSSTGFRTLATSKTFPVITKVGVGTTVVDGEAAPRTRWNWWGGAIVHTPPVEETGGRFVWTTWWLSSFGSMLGLVGLAWIIGGLAEYLINVRRYRRRRAPMGRIVRRGCTIAVVVAMIVGSIATVRSSSAVVQDYRATFAAERLVVAPTLLVRDLSAQRESPDRDHWLASAIAPALKSNAAIAKTTNGYLAACVTTDWQHDSEWMMWGERFNLVSMHRETLSYLGSGDSALESAPRFGLGWDGWRVSLRTSNGTTRRSEYSLDVRSLGSIFFVATVLFFVCSAVRDFFERREIRKRRALDRCIACDHQLRPKVS